MKFFRALAFSLVLWLAASSEAFAQMTNELGTVTALSIRKNFTPKWGIVFREELWTKDNVTALDLFLVRLTVNYRPVKWLTLSLGYDNLSSFSDAAQKGDLSVDAYVRNSHRFIVEATGTLPAGSLFSFSLRERYMYSYYTGNSVAAHNASGEYVTWTQGGSGSNVLRSKITATCRIPESKWSVYLGPEFFNSLNAGAGFALTQIRTYAGTTFKLSNVSTFKFYYCLQSRFNSRENHHLIGVDYYVTLP